MANNGHEKGPAIFENVRKISGYKLPEVPGGLPRELRPIVVMFQNEIINRVSNVHVGKLDHADLLSYQLNSPDEIIQVQTEEGPRIELPQKYAIAAVRNISDTFFKRDKHQMSEALIAGDSVTHSYKSGKYKDLVFDDTTITDETGRPVNVHLRVRTMIPKLIIDKDGEYSNAYNFAHALEQKKKEEREKTPADLLSDDFDLRFGIVASGGKDYYLLCDDNDVEEDITFTLLNGRRITLPRQEFSKVLADFSQRNQFSPNILSQRVMFDPDGVSQTRTIYENDRYPNLYLYRYDKPEEYVQKTKAGERHLVGNVAVYVLIKAYNDEGEIQSFKDEVHEATAEVRVVEREFPRLEDARLRKFLHDKIALLQNGEEVALLSRVAHSTETTSSELNKLLRLNVDYSDVLGEVLKTFGIRYDNATILRESLYKRFIYQTEKGDLEFIKREYYDKLSANDVSQNYDWSVRYKGSGNERA